MNIILRNGSFNLGGFEIKFESAEITSESLSGGGVPLTHAEAGPKGNRKTKKVKGDGQKDINAAILGFLDNNPESKVDQILDHLKEQGYKMTKAAVGNRLFIMKGKKVVTQPGFGKWSASETEQIPATKKFTLEQ